MALNPAFTLQLNYKLLPGSLTVGKYDGVHPCLTAATAAGKILIHNPHKRNQEQAGRLSEICGDVSLLNINQAVSSISSGVLDPTSNKDILVVGTPTNLLVYDVNDNADLFYKDVPDGVRTCIVGKMGGYDAPLALVGGNCSLVGFDKEGNDLFWSVTGDNVSSLALLDFTGSGDNELLVGSEDFDIRVFKQDEILYEMTETEMVTNLCAIQGSRFGYGLANGTVGVYEKSSRFWRIKSKNQPVSIFAYDINSDGVPELITGWSNGKLDARTDKTGEVIFKDNFSSSIAGITESDYRMDGMTLLMACSVDGEVKCWDAVAQDKLYLLTNTLDNDDMTEHSRLKMMKEIAQTDSLSVANLQQDAIRDLGLKKQNLVLELHNYEENQKVARGEITDRNQVDSVPANTQLKTALSVSREKGDAYVNLYVATTNDMIIRCVMIFAEGIFDGESYVMHPTLANLSTSMNIPIRPPKDITVDLHIKALVGQKHSSQFHVFELSRRLPRFSMYSLCSQGTPTVPRGYVQFQIQERIKRVVMWMNQNFLLDEDFEPSKGDLNVQFLALRSDTPLHIVVDQQGQVTIRSDDMDLAGDIVQSLCTYLNLDDVATTCEFSEVMAKLKDLLTKVDEYQSVRQRLVAEMADHSNLIKSLVVRAEDARMMSDMTAVKKAYMELYDLNRDLISGYKIRSNNHQELVNSLKQINQIIQKAGKLRVGRYKTQVISQCRNAIKTNTIGVLVKIIRFGSD